MKQLAEKPYPTSSQDKQIVPSHQMVVFLFWTGGWGGGGGTKPRIEIEFVWMHAHCSYVKAMYAPKCVRAVMRRDARTCPTPFCADRDPDRQARSCPALWKSGNSLFAKGTCSSIISSTEQACECFLSRPTTRSLGWMGLHSLPHDIQSLKNNKSFRDALENHCQSYKFTTTENFHIPLSSAFS